MQLVMNTRGASLRRRGDRFVIKAGENESCFSAHKIQSIVISTAVHLTSDAILLASQHNIDVVFLDQSGDPHSRVWQTQMGSTAAIRRRQLETAETVEGLSFVRDWTVGKTQNQIDFLAELRRRRPATHETLSGVIQTLTACQDRLRNSTGTIDEVRGTLMGIEGSAGRVYFSCLSKLMPLEYQFNGRSRKPARDAFNATLNYGYGVLYSLVERSCILAGLDPFVGFLHTDNYNKRSLVFDLIEPFRIIAERTSVLLFTGRRMKKDYIRDVPGGVELSPEGRAALITELNKRLDRTVRYPVQSKTPHVTTRLTPSPSTCTSPCSDNSPPTKRGPKRKPKFRKIKQRAVIQHEAHAFANMLLGRNDIPKLVETVNLWEETV